MCRRRESGFQSPGSRREQLRTSGSAIWARWSIEIGCNTSSKEPCTWQLGYGSPLHRRAQQPCDGSICCRCAPCIFLVGSLLALNHGLILPPIIMEDLKDLGFGLQAMGWLQARRPTAACLGAPGRAMTARRRSAALRWQLL